jgi:CheY-like chemotaxis protein
MFSEENNEVRRVLIIDDNDDAAQLLAMFIGALGHIAKVANDGFAGLALATAFMPQVVFLDLGMPGMSGYEVAPRLRKIAGLEHVYIAALTGWNDAQTRRQVVDCGFDRHLTKPATVDAIHAIVSAPDTDREGDLSLPA